MFDRHIHIRNRVAVQEAFEAWRAAEKRMMDYAKSNCTHANKARQWFNEARTWGQDTCQDCGLFVEEVFVLDEKKNHYRGPTPAEKV